MAVKSQVMWFQPQFSQFTKNVKTMGWILRFVKNARMSALKREVSQFLKIQETREAEKEVLKCVQKEAFPNGLEDVRSLKVKLEDGLMRIQ
jgi:hypothetical protein